MNLPFLSAICLQYCDVPQLEDALGCFLAQDYAGEHEIVVLNSFNRQKLHYDHPNVHIVNLETRPDSLSECRNLAIEHARGTHIVVWDSDDSFTPWYLSTIANHFGDGQWAWLDKQFYLVGWKIKNIVPGSMNSLIFTKEAWRKVGGYHVGMNVGEDRQFVGKITTQTPGKRVVLKPEEIGFLYSWGEGNYHISGQGDDVKGKVTSYERVKKHWEKRVSARLVPLGDIVLNPAMKQPYGEMAKRFVGSKPQDDASKGNVGVVMLGRYGDIINLLPFLKHVADNYAKPHLVISREFASILEGVSYVEPYPVDLPYDQLLPAIKIAERNYRHVIVGQTWGRGWSQPKLTDAYNKESWRQCGFLHRWNDASLVPVFDRRNLAREEALFTKLNVPDKPMLLYKLDGGLSSPCPECPTLAGPIREAFGDSFNVINLSDVKAERMFDLLGLFDRAACLVTIDTSLAHLAAGSRIPYVLLCNPLPWLGTSPRGNCAARMTYTEALAKPRALVTLLEMTFATDNAEVSDQRGAGSLH